MQEIKSTICIISLKTGNGILIFSITPAEKDVNRIGDSAGHKAER